MRGVPPEVAASDYWRAALLFAVMCGVLELAAMITELPLLGATVLIPIRIAHTALCAAVVLLLALRGRSAPLTFSRIMLLTVSLPLFVVFWIGQIERTHAGLLWRLFTGQIIAVFILAAMAPPCCISLLLILGFTLEAVVQTMVLDPAATPGEPWVSLIVGTFAIVLYLNRLRRLDAERRAADIRAKVESQARWTHTIFAINDLTHTPLQTLDLNVHLLRTRHPEAEDLAQRMARAILRLRELRALLEHYESSLQGQRQDESNDSAEALLPRRRRTTGPES